MTPENPNKLGAHHRTVAFIDANNLHRGILRLGWRLDYGLFRQYLANGYAVDTAILFLGYVPDYGQIYREYESQGYSLFFRHTHRTRRGEIKGNCDTDLAVQAVAGCCENTFDSAVLVTGDGDFASLSTFLSARDKLSAVIAPSLSSTSHHFSLCGINVASLEALRPILEEKPSLNLNL